MVGGRLVGQVRIVGAGLLGSSIGLGLRARGIETIVHDASPAALALAIDYGAGRAATELDDPGLIVVAVPPDLTAQVIARELSEFPNAIVTDVASIKLPLFEELKRLGVDTSRYLGSHPLAGRERGGAISARGDLFIGRPWVIATSNGEDANGEDAKKIAVIEDLILDLEAFPVLMPAEEHDRSVALVSHLPQVVSSLLAKRLLDGTDRSLGLAGQGLRDTTRIAASDPELWIQILSANHSPIVKLLELLRVDLDSIISTLSDPSAAGARRAIAQLLAAGNSGVSRLPGKHGQDRKFSSIFVMVEDRPGELARLLTEIGEAKINLEDLRLEHAPGALFGLAEIAVLPEAEERLLSELESRGWRIAEAYQ
ncbi:MAG: prephenate dehydrogenase [Cryobacterium sp.]|nr:prephenate dehydrogenase [Cryobacterium sp.]